MSENINIFINGKITTLSQSMTLAQALAEKGFVQNGFAVACNGDFVSRSQYETWQLQSQDVIEIVAPMQGG